MNLTPQTSSLSCAKEELHGAIEMTASMKSCLKDRFQACLTASNMEIKHEIRPAIQKDGEQSICHARRPSIKSKRLTA
jgi:hypothetical protein